MATNFTTELLAKLEAAIASGLLSVQYGDQRKTYHSLDEMLRARDLMRRELGVASASTRERRRLVSFDKGL